MKKIFKLSKAVGILCMVFLLVASTGNIDMAYAATGGVVVFSVLAHFSPAHKGVAFDGAIVIPDFTEKSLEDQEEMTFAELKEYRMKENDFISKTLEKRLQDQLDEINEGREEGKDMSAEIEAIETKMTKMIDEVNKHGLLMKKISEKGFSHGPNEVKTIKGALIERKDELDKFIEAKGGTFEMEVDISKASQSAADIDAGTDFAQIIPGVGQIARKKIYIKERIRIVPTNTEFIKFLDQETVVRDAKNVAGCAVSTSTTKLTWKTRTLQQQKIRDFIDVCIDMLEDYDFVEAEIRNLIESSVQLKIDNDLLLADGIAPNPNSIDSVSATFAAGDYALLVPTPTIIDLIVVVSAQIKANGQENFWNADTCYINPVNLTLLKLLKDNEENYIKGNSISPSIIMDRAGNIVVDGMVDLIPNPNVVTNQMYVFDSTQAAIYQRKTAVIEMSFENKSNFETETVTVKAYERLNLLVRNVNANAFIHVPNITTAIAAITKP